MTEPIMPDPAAVTLSYQTNLPVFASNRARTILAMCTLGLALLAQVACVIVGWRQLQLLQFVKSGGKISAAAAALNDNTYEGAHIAWLIGLIVSVIFVLIWMYRAYKNLQAFANRPLLYSPGGAVGWWFCPIANLFRPYQVMKEIFVVSHDGFRKCSTAVVGIWWAFWIIGNIVARITSNLPGSPEEGSKIDYFINQTWASMADIPMSMVAGILLMWIIFSIDRVQEERRNVLPAAI